MSRLRIAGLALVLLVVIGGIASMVAQFIGVGETVPDVTREARAERVRVEVLNAAGIPGLARIATRSLRDEGFDVVDFGNAAADTPDSTVVIDRVGRPELASEVGAALEIGRTETRLDPGLLLEVTVILGRDWRGIPQQAPSDSAAPDSVG